jgi:hypothetical protein
MGFDFNHPDGYQIKIDKDGNIGSVDSQAEEGDKILAKHYNKKGILESIQERYWGGEIKSYYKNNEIDTMEILVYEKVGNSSFLKYKFEYDKEEIKNMSSPLDELKKLSYPE